MGFDLTRCKHDLEKPAKSEQLQANSFLTDRRPIRKQYSCSTVVPCTQCTLNSRPVYVVVCSVEAVDQHCKYLSLSVWKQILRLLTDTVRHCPWCFVEENYPTKSLKHPHTVWATPQRYILGSWNFECFPPPWIQNGLKSTLLVLKIQQCKVGCCN